MIVEGCESSMCNVEDRVAKASKAYENQFSECCHLRLKGSCTKPWCWGFCTVLYEVQTLILKRVHSHKLEVVHNRCLGAILCITRAKQKMERITMAQVREMIGILELLQALRI